MVQQERQIGGLLHGDERLAGRWPSGYSHARRRGHWHDGHRYHNVGMDGMDAARTEKQRHVRKLGDGMGDDSPNGSRTGNRIDGTAFAEEIEVRTSETVVMQTARASQR